MLSMTCRIALVTMIFGILHATKSKTTHNAVSATSDSTSDLSVCSNGCIPVPDMGWNWPTFRAKIFEENEAGHSDVAFCGPFNFTGKASIATRNIPNVRKLVCCNGPCMIVVDLGLDRRAFRFNSDDFMLKGFHLRTIDTSGLSDGVLISVNDAKKITLEDCVFEVGPDSYLSVGTYIRGESRHILLNRCTWTGYIPVGGIIIGKEARDVIIRHSLMIRNAPAIYVDPEATVTMEGCVITEHDIYGRDYEYRTDNDIECYADDYFSDFDDVFLDGPGVTLRNNYFEDRILYTSECFGFREEKVDEMVRYLTGLDDCEDGDLLRHFDGLIDRCGRVKGLKDKLLVSGYNLTLRRLRNQAKIPRL